MYQPQVKFISCLGQGYHVPAHSVPFFCGMFPQSQQNECFGRNGQSLALDGCLHTLECLEAFSASAHLCQQQPSTGFDRLNVSRHWQMFPGQQNYHQLKTAALWEWKLKGNDGSRSWLHFNTASWGKMPLWEIRKLLITPCNILKPTQASHWNITKLNTEGEESPFSSSHHDRLRETATLVGTGIRRDVHQWIVRW